MPCHPSPSSLTPIPASFVSRHASSNPLSSTFSSRRTQHQAEIHESHTISRLPILRRTPSTTAPLTAPLLPSSPFPPGVIPLRLRRSLVRARNIKRAAVLALLALGPRRRRVKRLLLVRHLSVATRLGPLVGGRVQGLAILGILVREPRRRGSCEWSRRGRGRRERSTEWRTGRCAEVEGAEESLGGHDCGLQLWLMVVVCGYGAKKYVVS